MSGILSPQEIDSLLSDFGGNDPAGEGTDAPTAQPGAVRFDFKTPRRLTGKQLQALRAIHESFAETFASFLVARLQTSVAVSVTSIDQMYYSGFVSGAEKPSCLYVLRIGETGHKAAIDVSPRLALALIARMLGGKIQEDESSRPLTKIEQNIIKTVMQRCVGDLRVAWEALTTLNVELERYEIDADLMQVAASSEIILLVVLEFTIEQKTFGMRMCVPVSAIEDSLEQFLGPQATQDEKKNEITINQGLLRQIEQTAVPASCVLGATRLTVRQLMDLEEGDVLVTSTSITGELSLIVGGKERARGRPGISNGKKALKITNIHETDTGE